MASELNGATNGKSRNLKAVNYSYSAVVLSWAVLFTVPIGAPTSKRGPAHSLHNTGTFKGVDNGTFIERLGAQPRV